MDVKTAFLHGSIKEEVYVEQPEEFEIYDRESHVCRLKKALYGLKQAPQARYERIDSYLMKLEFTRSETDPSLYFKVIDDKSLILVLYVDDLSNRCRPSHSRIQHMVEPHHSHWIGAKNLLRYLCGTISHGLRYTGEDVRLLGYTDADWAGSVVDQKSTSECCFSLGSALISWMSRKQKSVALSTAKAEYIAASMASCEVVWYELFGFTLDTTMILCDNQSEICLSENPIFHDCSKHIDIRYHYIRDMVQRGAIRLQYIGTNEQVADILTKPLGKVKLLTFRERLGVV
eukprot:PITA_29937